MDPNSSGILELANFVPPLQDHCPAKLVTISSTILIPTFSSCNKNDKKANQLVGRLTLSQFSTAENQQRFQRILSQTGTDFRNGSFDRELEESVSIVI